MIETKVADRGRACSQRSRISLQWGRGDCNWIRQPTAADGSLRAGCGYSESAVNRVDVRFPQPIDEDYYIVAISGIIRNKCGDASKAAHTHPGRLRTTIFRKINDGGCCHV